MTDIILINPPNTYDNFPYKNSRELCLYPPLGILYIASALNDTSLKVEVMDIVAQKLTLKQTIEILIGKKPKIIGITATSPQIRGAVQIAKEMKNYMKDILIGIGGAHVSAVPQFINDFECFDFAVVGEGESTFKAICREVFSNGYLEKKLYFGEAVKNLDNTVYLNRDLLDRSLYFMEPYGHDFVSIHTTRGCPFNCLFCSNPITSRNVRYRTPENILLEIESCLDKYKIKFVNFTDDTFTLNRERVINICNLIIKKKLGFEWCCGTRADLVDSELLCLMYEAGCRNIGFGVESGDEELRGKIVNKKIKNRDLLFAFKECKKLGIETSAYCMLGFPGETREKMYQTLKFCKKLNPDVVGFHLAVAMPGSSLYNQAIDENKINKEYWENYAKGIFKEQPVYVPDGMLFSEIKRIQKDIYLKYYFRPKYIIRRFLLDIKSFRKLKLDFLTGVSLFRSAGTASGRP